MSDIREDFEPGISNWQKFKMLVWKNWCIQWNNRRQFIFSILSPMTFCCILIYLRFSIAIEEVPTNKYGPVDIKRSWQTFIKAMKERYEKVKENPSFTYNVYIPRLTVVFAPENVAAFQNIMSAAMARLDNFDFRGFSTCEKLKKSMQTEYYLAGVCFENIPRDMKSETIHMVNNYPNRLNYSLIFPSELRIYNDSYISFNWETNMLYESKYYDLYRVNDANDGGYVGYIREGFIPLRNVIAMPYISLMTEVKDLPDIFMHRFPYGQHLDDALAGHSDEILPMIILTGYLYPILVLAKYIVRERERGSTMTLKLMGIPHKMHSGAWFVNGLAVLSFGSFLLLIVLKVQWHQEYAILDKSSCIAVFIAMSICNIYTICFCLMMSAFISETSSMAVVPLIWIILFIPYITTSRYEIFSPITQMLMCIFFPNTAMAFVFDHITSYEDSGGGFEFKSFFDTDLLSTKFSVAAYLLVIIITALIFWFIGSYMDGIKLISSDSIAEKWYTAVINRFRKKSEPHRSAMRSTYLLRRTKIYEIDKSSKRVAVKMENVTKVYKGNIVLRDISLKLFKDDITILMGHNGSGKTVLLKILAGLIHLSDGKVYINNTDVQLHPANRKSMGVYLTGEYLYKDLTVSEQLTLVSRFRGFSEIATENEVSKYISEIGLLNERDVKIMNLPDGMKQKLAVACALAGQTKIVLLDDPTSQLDFQGRVLIWKLLIKEKGGRTILVATHNNFEAEVMGDRFAILTNGELKCSGTAAFIRKIYGDGYSLKCYKGPNCNTDRVTEIVQKYAKNKTIESNVGAQFSYTLADRHLDVLEQLLDELDTNADELNLAGYSITENSMESLILKLGSENLQDDDKVRLTEIMMGQSIYSVDRTEDHEQLAYLKKFKPLANHQLWLNHWAAMFYKRYVHMKHNKGMATVTALTPILYISVAFCIANLSLYYIPVLQALSYDLDQYESAITLIDGRKSNNSLDEIVEQYSENVFWMGYKIEETGDATIPTYILEKLNYRTERMNHKYLVGVSSGPNGITAWFNNYPLHTAPLSLNMVHNAIVKRLESNDAEIHLQFDPLPFSQNDHVMLMRSSISFGSMLAINLLFCITLTWSLNVTFLVRERQTDFKLLQFMSGIRVLIFLMATILFDSLQIIAFALTILITIVLFHHLTFLKYYLIVAYFLVLIIGGICAYAFNHFLSIFFRDYVNAHNTITTFNIFGCASYYAILVVAAEGFNESYLRISGINWLFYCFPQFSFANALIKTYNIGQMSRICENENIKFMSTAVESCKVTPNCCVDYEIMCFGNGILGDIIYLMVVAAICLTFVIVKEHRIRCRISDRAYETLEIKEEKKRESMEASDIQDEVADETDKVVFLKLRDYHTKSLICNDVHKKLGKTVIFKNLYLIVERGECFGLLGYDASILLKLLIGTENLTAGNIYVDGHDTCADMNEMRKYISYAPQQTNLPAEYMVSEILKIYCLLRGIPRSQTKQICESLAKAVGLYGHYNKQIKCCSEGSKKRLNLASAMLGNPSIVYMDQPARSLDAAGRLQLWNVIGRLCNNGASVMFTSLVVKDCEDICARLALIADGRIRSMAKPWELSKKYAYGYLLIVKLKSTLKAMLNFSTFMENEFPMARLNEHCGNVMMFFLPSKTTTMSAVFGKLRRDAFILNVETFYLSRDISSLLHVGY